MENYVKNKKNYKFVDDLVSDVMFEVWGKDMSELMENASKAMFSIICQIDKVQPKKDIEIQVEADDERELLYKWLSNLLAEFEVEDMFFCDFKISVTSENGKLKASGTVFGEEMTPEKGGTVVKAIPLYNFSLTKKEGEYRATIVCDV